MNTSLLTFTGLVLGLTMLPGANTMLVIQNSLLGGHRTGLLMTLGGCFAILVHAAFSAFGLSLLLVSSAAAFEVVRLIGGGYLLYLGLRALFRAWHSDYATLTIHNAMTVKPGRASFFEGFISNLFSPETTVFYLAALPQFFEPGESIILKTFLLAGVHFTVRLTWMSLLTLFVSQIRAFLLRPLVRRSIETVTGGMLMIFGLRILTARR